MDENQIIEAKALDYYGMKEKVETYLEKFILFPRESLNYGLSPDRLMVYMLLFDRVKLSMTKYAQEGQTAFIDKIKGKIYPFCIYTQDELANELGRSVKTIHNICKELEEKGFIIKQIHKTNTLKKPNKYYICPLPFSALETGMRKNLEKEIQTTIADYEKLMNEVYEIFGTDSKEYGIYQQGKKEYFTYDNTITRTLDELKTYKENMKFRFNGADIHLVKLKEANIQKVDEAKERELKNIF